MNGQRKVIATASYYRQESRFRRLWSQLAPLKLTLDDFATALNGMLVCFGAPGSGKSGLIAALAQAYITSGVAAVMVIDTGLDVFRQVLNFCIRSGVPP